MHIFTSKITLLNNIDLRYLQRLTLKKLVYEIREDSTTHDTNYPDFVQTTFKKDQRGHQQTKKNQLTNERRLSMTATLLQILQITFSNQSCNVRLTNSCALESNDFY